MNRKIIRREFLGRAAAGSALVSFGANAPNVFCRAAETSANEGRVLVVVELAGGNDGLNCIVPHSNHAYLKSRQKLRIAAPDTLAVTTEIGLHRSMRGFADLLESGHFAVVQGVGYPNPNRSHFESMDIWHSCFRKHQPRSDGWIGRYLQSAGLAGTPDPPAIHLGREKQPFALASRDIHAVSIGSIDQFRLAKNQRAELKSAIRELARRPESHDAGNDLLGFVRASTETAITASDKIELAATSKAGSSAVYPRSELGRQLETVAKLISSKMQTRIYYVRLNGFDTHANQPLAHAALLRDVSDSVNALMQDLHGRGDGDRTLVMCFSEFGRRVAENASSGTDHGTAGPVLFAGRKLNAGLIGPMPSLTDLDNGDLKFHTDFRSVYATVLKEWLACAPDDVLGGKFASVDLFA